MAKRNPPPAGYWIHCIKEVAGPDLRTHSCDKAVHDSTCSLSVYHTDGTLKNMKYVHFSWGTEWNPLNWTGFPSRNLRHGELEHFSNLADLKVALGNHRFNNFI